LKKPTFESAFCLNKPISESLTNRNRIGFHWKPLWFLSLKHQVKAKRQPEKPMTRAHNTGLESCFPIENVKNI